MQSENNVIFDVVAELGYDPFGADAERCDDRGYESGDAGCSRCGAYEAYEGHCACDLVAAHDSDELAFLDAEIVKRLTADILSGNFYPVFGSDDPGSSAAALDAALLRWAQMDVDDDDAEVLLDRIAEVMKADRQSVANEAFRRASERDGKPFTPITQATDLVDLSPQSAAYTAVAQELGAGVGSSTFEIPSSPTEGGSPTKGIGAVVQGMAQVKLSCPVEPYNNGYCWFYAIDPENRERMWDETECAAFASLREINQLGREYGFSRTRLIIRRISDGKYHMEPDVGGTSGTARNFQAWMDEIYSPNGIHSRAKSGVFGMPYSNFEGKMRTASLGNWVEVSLLLQTVNACLGRDFSKVTERKASADDYRKMDRASPFAKYEQFPNHTQYVWMDGGDWPNKEMQLYSALAYQDVSVEENRAPQGDRQRPTQATSNSFGYNDAATAYYNALRNMKNQIVTLSGVYDRETIQTAFRSFWTVDKLIDLRAEISQVLQPSQVLVDEHGPGAWTWPGRNRCVELSDVNADNALPSSGIAVLWSNSRVGNHRCRSVVQRDTHGGLNAISHELVATND